MRRVAMLMAAVGAFSCSTRAAPPPPPADGWHRIAPGTADELSLKAAGATGDRLFLAGSLGRTRWLTFVDRDGQTTKTTVRTYGGGGIVAAAPTAGGGLVLGGYGEAGKPWLGEVDRDGTLRWQLEPKTEVNGEIYSIIATPGGGAVAAGMHNPLAMGRTDGWLMAVGPGGQLRWEKRLGAGSYHFLKSVIALPGGRLMALGAKKVDTYLAWIVTVGADGGDVREQVRASQQWEQLGPVVDAPGDTIYALGESTAQQGLARSEGKALVERIGADGALVWRAEIGERVVSAASPVATPDGVAFVAATLTGKDVGELWLVRVSADGKRDEWAKLDAGAVMLDYVTQAGFLVPRTGGGLDVLLVRPAKGALEWRLAPAPGGEPPVYPGARRLCAQHIAGAGGSGHIQFALYATADAFEDVAKFYRARFPAATGDDKEIDVKLPGDRAISIHRPGAGHPTCDVAPAGTDRAVIVVSQMIR